jgi:hypothetical protein
MISYLSLNIKELTVNFVGNKTKDESYFLSKDSIREIDELTKEALIKYFIESFKNEVYFNFHHVSNIELNEVYHYANKIFDTPKLFHKVSNELTKLLYDKTNHPNIKGGEFYIVYFKNIALNDLITDAIGLFKSENRDTFLKVYLDNQNYKLECHQGININKLEKGCLIFNTDRKNGYQVCVLDNLNKSIEAQYWKDEFLKIKPSNDNYHTTQNYLDICKNFVTNQLQQEYEINKTDKIDYLNKTVDYFKKNTAFNEKEFLGEVFEDKSVIKSFRNFKQEYASENEIELNDTFEISNTALKKQLRVFKSVLKLDKNFHVYIHGDKNLIEKGYDAKVGKNYYKIYFDEES